jgi:transposase InsO family protein
VVRLLRLTGGSADLVKGRGFLPLAAFSTDFTELVYAQGSHKAWLMALVDIPSKWIGGWGIGKQRNRGVALACLDRLGASLATWGRTLHDVIIHHDRDSVYLSYDWLHRLLMEEQARVSFAEHGAKDNPWIESFWGRFKTENHDLIWEAQSLEELAEIVEQQMAYYNHKRRHSTLEYQRPEEIVSARTIGGCITPNS